ncbi:MAG TPA: TlpA disulfide reductase family protein [Thermoleophilaceae bacterium]|nr:TlpA disulfide reductase family protein [Thermoleophilaceae bacterium]
MRPAAVATVCALALAACGASDGDSPDPRPSPLLEGGVPAFKAKLKELRGRPVVVNKWASWCGPCRAEFPHLRRQAKKRRGQVAFLGVNSFDNEGNAREFLQENPVPFRSFKDPDSKIAAEIEAGQAFPATAFFDRRGRLEYVKQGYYSTERQLAEDIERYAR